MLCIGFDCFDNYVFLSLCVSLCVEFVASQTENCATVGYFEFIKFNLMPQLF
jgi:hypothetical protein